MNLYDFSSPFVKCLILRIFLFEKFFAFVDQKKNHLFKKLSRRILSFNEITKWVSHEAYKVSFFVEF